jgi:hypothetical protein
MEFDPALSFSDNLIRRMFSAEQGSEEAPAFASVVWMASISRTPASLLRSTSLAIEAVNSIWLSRLCFQAQ